MVFLNALEQLSNFLNVNLEELPFDIYTTDGACFPLCFYFSETDDYLIVFATQDDGREKLVSVAKAKITSWNIVYHDDIQKLTEDDPEKPRAISSYE